MGQQIRGGQPIRLGIVDDHPVFRLGLRLLFEREVDVEVAWDLGSATELLTTLASAPVDVVLMDLNLGPEEDSLAETRVVVERYPDVKVVFISASLDGDAAAAARAAGAVGYLPKDLSVHDTMGAIRGLAATGKGEIASKLGVSIATVNKHVQQVLKKLHVRNRGQAVARLNGDAAWRIHQANIDARGLPGSTKPSRPTRLSSRD